MQRLADAVAGRFCYGALKPPPMPVSISLCLRWILALLMATPAAPAVAIGLHLLQSTAFSAGVLPCLPEPHTCSMLPPAC